MNSCELLEGRPYWGITILYTSSCKVTHLQFDSSRVCAINITIDEVDLCDTNAYNEEVEYSNVISEIKKVCKVIYYVIAGNLNIDLSRLQSCNTLHLHEFANEEDLEYCKLIHILQSNRGYSSCIDHDL